jgi:hypothetical protein
MRRRDALANFRREARIGIGPHRLVVDLGERELFLSGLRLAAGKAI